jgi:tetratricopeptide (TPR) repeat protein
LRAEQVLALHLPRIAERAERLVMRVLQLAGDDEEGIRDDEIRDAASAIRVAPGDPALEPDISGAEARQLHAAARAAFQHGGRLDEALDLQKRAFGANPLNAEVTGYLAFLRLRQRPAQVESARQLALHALTTYDVRYPQGRIDDWTTLAVASALSGRDRDARNAWFVTLALVPDPQRQCRAAVNAYAMYGERLRVPVEAMLQRVHATGRSDASPLCEWPPHWLSANRMR